MLRQLRVIPLLIDMYVRSQMEYRSAFWLDRFAQILSYGAAFATIGILLARFGTLGGWDWPELAMLFSFQLLAYSLGASLSFVQLRDLEELVRLGKFDVLLVKPFSPWAYLVFSGLEIGYIGHIILAATVMVWAVLAVDVEWSIWRAFFLLGALLSSTAVIAAIMTMIAATALIWVRSNHLFAIFFGFWELTRYPLNIYPGGIQLVLVTVLPLAMTSSVPIGALLDKQLPIIGEWGGLIALGAGPLWATLAVIFWRYAIGRYQGAGG